MRNKLIAGILAVFLIFVSSCKQEGEPMQAVDSLDINKFMGDWYVQGLIPNFVEKNAKNGLESYRLNEKGQVEITYTLEKDGEMKELNAKAFIQNEDSTIWKVQFFWPLRFPYYVIDLEKNYQYTVIGVPNRKYVWIMSRQKDMPEATYSAILDSLEAIGYDRAKIVKMEQEQ